MPFVVVGVALLGGPALLVEERVRATLRAARFAAVRDAVPELGLAAPVPVPADADRAAHPDPITLFEIGGAVCHAIREMTDMQGKHQRRLIGTASAPGHPFELVEEFVKYRCASPRRAVQGDPELAERVLAPVTRGWLPERFARIPVAVIDGLVVATMRTTHNPIAPPRTPST